MSSAILDNLQKAIYDGFKGKLHEGRLHRRVTSATAVLDANRDPVASPSSWPMEGFIDQYSPFTINTGGVPKDAEKVCIFGYSLEEGTIKPKKGDVAYIDGSGYYELLKGDVDPAAALYECQAHGIPKPAWIP